MEENLDKKGFIPNSNFKILSQLRRDTFSCNFCPILKEERGENRASFSAVPVLGFLSLEEKKNNRGGHFGHAVRCICCCYLELYVGVLITKEVGIEFESGLLRIVMRIGLATGCNELG
ncbi:hypothetical protein AABB24_010850 [Solanum stoloniferum]|uniref:Uncharacterized protein n=1 Tax=Solanum stoloniferum TaxID=62892 RepID=A0ABD2UEA9_9SOLN